MARVGRARGRATVLVAVRSPQVREGLAAMIGALDGYRVVAEAASDDQAVELARSCRPRLALVDQELSECASGWTIQALRREGLVRAVVALGRRADDGARARAVGACAYVEMGSTPGDILRALERANRHPARPAS